MKVLSDTGHMTVRHLMALWRQPWWIAVSLVQPVIWLLLFGALFKAVTNIPGFGSNNYIQFLAPGEGRAAHMQHVMGNLVSKGGDQRRSILQLVERVANLRKR